MTFSKHLISIVNLALFLPPVALANGVSLSFDRAWELVQQNNPELSAVQSGVAAAEGAATKAGARPNPELSLEAENFGGTGQNSGWNSAETTLLISQPIETGGKRRARLAEGRAGAELSRAEAATLRLDLWRLLVERYAEALQAVELETIAAENVRLAGERARLVSLRVGAGKVAPLEAARAEVESTLAGVELTKTRRQAKLAHRRLAALMGSSQPDTPTLTGRLDTVREWKPPWSAGDSLQAGPDLIRMEKEIAVRQTALKREETLRLPDVALSAGARRFEATGDTAWVGGIALPLPLFDRNSGGIRKASHELSRASQLQQAAILKQQGDLEELLAAAETGWNEITVLRDKALPTARDAMEKARAGYEQGKFSYLEWVDAERSFMSLRTRWIATLTDYHKNLAAMGRLTGKIPEITLFNQP